MHVPCAARDVCMALSGRAPASNARRKAATLKNPPFAAKVADMAVEDELGCFGRSQMQVRAAAPSAHLRTSNLPPLSRPLPATSEPTEHPSKLIQNL